MSYSGQYIDPIFDRELEDVYYAIEHPTETCRGAYNYVDLNRIENNTRYVANDMYTRGITDQPIQLNSKYDWNEKDIPTREQMNRIINNILLLKSLSVEDLDWVPFATAGQMTYIVANAIEKNLDNMLHQKLPEPDTFLLEVENGSGTGRYLEDTVVPIEADFPPVDMIFDRWSGSDEDIDRVANVYASSTTFTMWHKDAKVTANYIGAVPHKLNIIKGSGSGEYKAGEIIPIQADIAPNDYVFHHWEGDFAENCVNDKASTTSFVMPNEATTLTAFYIHPGKHQLNVVRGSGSGMYEYGEHVFVSGNSPGPKYTFSHWSGDTIYLNDAKSEGTSLVMPDVPIKIVANYIYNPDEYELTVVNGSGSGKYKDSTWIPIMANPADTNFGFFKWEISGAGSFNYQAEWNASTSIYLGEGNCTVTATYAPTHHVTVIGGTGGGDLVEGRRYTISANNPQYGQTFSHWKEGDTSVSTDINYTFTMGDTDRTLEAVYKEAYNLSVVNGTGSGVYSEGTRVNIKANSPEEGYLFAYWEVTEGSISWSYGNKYSSSTTVEIRKSNATLTAIYKPSHTLTVNNGTGSGVYYEGQSIEVRANAAPSGYRFKGWEGDIDNLSNPTSTKTYYEMGTADATITATYEILPDWNLTVIDGQGSGPYKQGTDISIIANEAEDGYRFLTWVGDTEQIENIWASTSRVLKISKDTKVTATYYVPENPDRYLLTVNQGWGGGKHPAGSIVNIQADYPLEGYEFWKWTGDIATITDIRAEKTTMVMPAYATTITATYKIKGTTDLFTLTVNYGSGSGDYEEGTEVEIIANDPTEDFQFDKWLGDTENILELREPRTIFTIGREDAVITASYKPKQRYTLEVTGGVGSGSYYEGQRVEIIANMIDTDDIHYKFIGWSGDTETIEEIDKSDTFIVMPPKGISIKAEYEISYHLIVTNGQGSGYFKEGDVTTIKAADPAEGYEFTRWTGDTSILSSIYNKTPTVTMGASVASVTAKYREIGSENSIGKYLGVFSETENVIETESPDIEMISGNFGQGTILTDKIGNIGICTELIPESTTCKVQKYFFSIENQKEE